MGRSNRMFEHMFTISNTKLDIDSVRVGLYDIYCSVLFPNQPFKVVRVVTPEFAIEHAAGQLSPGEIHEIKSAEFVYEIHTD